MSGRSSSMRSRTVESTTAVENSTHLDIILMPSGYPEAMETFKLFSVSIVSGASEALFPPTNADHEIRRGRKKMTEEKQLIFRLCCARFSKQINFLARIFKTCKTEFRNDIFVIHAVLINNERFLGLVQLLQKKRNDSPILGRNSEHLSLNLCHISPFVAWFHDLCSENLVWSTHFHVFSTKF